MKKSLVLACLALFLVLGYAMAQQSDSQEKPIDWNYARQLHQKEVNHQPLTDEEKAYLARAKAALVARGGGPGPGAGGNAVGVMPAGPATQVSKTGLIPLCDMTADQKYKGEDGGLYGSGQNDPPPAQLDAAKKALAQVRKLDADGNPSPDGKIVLLSVGMSNTSMKFMRFMADEENDHDKNPAIVLIDGAQGGMEATRWGATSGVWKVVEERLAKANVTAEQVQVIWLLQAIAGPARFGEFPKSAEKMRDLLIETMPLLLEHYPNLKIVYLSSRTYAGYAKSGLNPEPYAYEGAFAMRWLIQDQIKGDDRLNFDPAKGPVKSAILLWGPYVWADGVNPRKSDGLTYIVGDYSEKDGTHPTASGQEKVAKQLQAFFKNDLNSPWYIKGGAK